MLERDGLTVTAFVVDHNPVPPAVGYRFDFAGRSVAVTGDTKKNANLQPFAAGVRLPLSSLEEIFLDGVAETQSGPLNVGRDGALVQLPAA